MSKKKNPTLKIRAKLGKASVGKEAASVTFKTSRKVLTLEKAEAFLCGARLMVTIYEDENPDQKAFPGFEGAKLNGVVDVKRFSVSPDEISGTLAFAVNEIDRHEIADFAQKDVAIIAERTGDAAIVGGDEE